MRKVVEFEDKNMKFILLDRGEYLIDNEIVSVTEYGKSRVKVINENDVRLVKTTTVTDHYINVEDGSTMTATEYNAKHSELTKHRTYDDYDDEVWDSLEDEFNYKKFMQLWKRVDKNIQTISDPILVEKVKVKYETGNEFIVNAYLNGYSEHDLYIYNRGKAYLHIVKECFDELNMTYEEGYGYERTKNKKIWSNSNHSGIRYVKAFGNYLFDDRFNNTSNSRGTYEDMLKMYEKDRNSIRKIIKNGYIAHFGNVDESKVDFKMLLNNLYHLRESINSIQSKKSTWDNQKCCK